MTHLDSRDVTNGYRERMRRLALFEPLYELERMQKKDGNGKVVPMKDFGLLSLLFFFEHKLMRNQKVGNADLGRFLEGVTSTRFVLSADDYVELAREIIAKFRPVKGKKRSVTFINWELNTEETVQFSYLRDNDFESGVQYYALDEDGLELIFATREFYSEFQLSIHQLMLRKQLEKGEFKGALRQINEMRIDVEALYDRMTKLTHEIKRNIISDETFARYGELLDDIYARLQRENEEFKELDEFVHETRERLYYEDTDKQERKAYRYALQIAKELGTVHSEHSLLLNQCIHLKNHALKAAHESLYYAGVDSFNFEQDIASRLLAGPAAIESMKGLVAPFMPIEQMKVWSPLAILEKQVVAKNHEESVDQQEFIHFDEERDEAGYSGLQRESYARFMQLLLAWLEQDDGDTLTSFIYYLGRDENQNVLGNRMFYEFLVVLHQRSPLQREASAADHTADYALADCLTMLGGRTLFIYEQYEILQVTERFSIQQMCFHLEVKEDVD